MEGLKNLLKVHVSWFGFVWYNPVLYSGELECILTTLQIRAFTKAPKPMTSPSTILLLSSDCHLCLCVSLFQNELYWHCRASPSLLHTVCNTQLTESICKCSYPDLKHLIWRWVQMRQQQYWTPCCDSKQWPKWNSFTYLFPFPFYFLTYLSE